MSGNSWQNARFFEYRNTGAGATANADRPQLTDAQAAIYTSQRYLAGADGWNPTWRSGWRQAGPPSTTGRGGGCGAGRLRRVPRLARMMLVPSAGRACEV